MPSKIEEQLAQEAASLAVEESIEPVEEQEVKKEEDPIFVAFANLPNAPGPDQVTAWKQMYGDIYLMAFEQDEIYVIRAIRRLEYKQLSSMIKDNQQADAFQEQIVSKCLLWPQMDVTWSAGCKAGTIPTLFEVIMEHSNFLSPQLAIQMTRKL
jgi:hypothetical protein